MYKFDIFRRFVISRWVIVVLCYEYCFCCLYSDVVIDYAFRGGERLLGILDKVAF